MPDYTLDALSYVARPGSPLYRIMQRRIASPPSHAVAGGSRAPGSPTSVLRASVPSLPRHYTGTASVPKSGGSAANVMRGDFQMGGYPMGGAPHLGASVKLSPNLRPFGNAVSTQNGYDVKHPSIPGMIASATRLRGTGIRPLSRHDAVGMRGPW